MLTFDAIVLKFKEKGEKTGWTYISIEADKAELLNLGVKIAYRVKGLIDKFEIKQIAFRPMGDGTFILPLNDKIRKDIKKRQDKK